MANYVKATDFASKDALVTGNPLKIIKGTEINTEFNAIQTAIATKADLASPAFSGNPTATTQATGNNSSRLATTEFVHNQIDADVAALGLGTMATQNANNVSITGGAISGLTSFVAPTNATGTTPAVGDSTTKLATTAFVNAEIANDIASYFTGAGNQSIANPGYQKLPGGLIIQWGSTNVTSGTLVVTYPIPFPNAVLTAVASFGNLSNPENPIQVVLTSNSQLTLITFAGLPTNKRWIAIGY